MKLSINRRIFLKTAGLFTGSFLISKPLKALGFTTLNVYIPDVLGKNYNGSTVDVYNNMDNLSGSGTTIDSSASFLVTGIENIVNKLKDKFSNVKDYILYYKEMLGLNLRISKGALAGGVALGSLAFAPNVKAQSAYTINVKDIIGSVDSAAVTFGDTTKYTSKGVVRFFNPIIVGIENDKNVIPTSFNVTDAYPNPVKENNVDVDFATKKYADFKFEVYDIRGSLISSGERKFSTGKHSVKIEGLNNLANGVYFLRIRKDKESYVKKFINLSKGNTGYSQLRFLFFPGTGNVGFLSKSKVGSYIQLKVEKGGYTTYEAQIDPSQTSVSVDLEREGKTLAGKKKSMIMKVLML